MTISDEIREWCDICCDGSITKDDFSKSDFDELRELADRIDRETAELPKDADGVPFHVGDKVYRDGVGKLEVRGINLMRHAVTVECECPDGTACMVFPTGIAHIRTDSLEQIADELEGAEKWCDQNGDYGTGISSIGSPTLHEWADRIRKLAKEGEHED